MVWLPLVAQGGPTFPLRARPAARAGCCPSPPAAGTARGDHDRELSPLPFAGAAVFRRLPGLPTFYLAPVTPARLPAHEDDFVRGSDTVAGRGRRRGRRAGLRRPARALPGSLDRADRAGDDRARAAADIAAWRELDRFAPTEPELRVLDHVGRPLAGASDAGDRRSGHLDGRHRRVGLAAVAGRRRAADLASRPARARALRAGPRRPRRPLHQHPAR